MNTNIDWDKYIEEHIAKEIKYSDYILESRNPPKDKMVEKIEKIWNI